MAGVFEPWVGQPVVLKVALGPFKVSLVGQVLKEHAETLVMRPQCGPDVEISKTNVLAIEDACSHGLRAYSCCRSGNTRR
jgi:hypothetical protein